MPALSLLQVCLLVGLLHSTNSATIRNESREEVPREGEMSSTRRGWLSEIMADTLPEFVPSSSSNPECTKQGLLYKRDLQNLTLWAVQMLDASAITEVGVLSGNEYNAGDFDQCIKINVPEYNLRGKHCFANVQFKPLYYNVDEPHNISNFMSLSPMDSVWSKIKRVTDDRIKKRNKFFWSICIPSACSHTDLQESLNMALQPRFLENGIQINLTVDEIDCEEGDFTFQFTTGTYVYMIVLVALLLIVVLATSAHALFYESYADEKEGSSVLLMFSAISNTQKLLNNDGKPELRFLSGLKVLSMFLIIYGHRMLQSMYWPLFNAEDQEKMFDTFLETINLNGPIIVNTFLIATGFLIFNKLLNDIKKKRTIHLPVYIFYRWARSTPVYAFVICTIIFTKPLLNNEPLYKHEALWRVKACTENFWAHMLYINNYYNANTECLLPAWYLAVDMQLYIVCVITGYILSKSRKIGYSLLGLLLVVSFAVPAVLTYLHRHDGTLKLYLNFLDRYYEKKEYVQAYIPTHMRAGPYVMGMLSAVVLMKLQKINYKFSQRFIGVVLAIILGVGSLLSAWIFYLPERPTSLLENSLYVSFHRIAWGLCITWIIVAGVVSGFGKYQVFLDSYIFVPLNKLTLNALLIHPLLQGQTFLMQHHPEYFNLFIVVWKTCGDIGVTYILSYILHCLVEAPFARMQDSVLKKLFLKKSTK